jgi:hypothetical protein
MSQHVSMTRGMQGLYLSCDVVHEEMEHEFVSKARRLFDSMRAREKVPEPKLHGIRLDVARQGEFHEAIQVSTVTMDYMDNTDLKDRKQRRGNIRAAIEYLRREFRLSRPTHKIRFHLATECRH